MYVWRSQYFRLYGTYVHTNTKYNVHISCICTNSHNYTIKFYILRVCCCMVPLALVRPSWLEQWPTTLSAASFEYLAQSWCRSTSVRGRGWLGSSSSWRGSMPLQLSSWMRLIQLDRLDWEGDLEVGPLFLCVDSPGYHS